LVKLVGWIKRQPETPKASGASLMVKTGKDHLLSALDHKAERLWIENADQIGRWIAEHRVRLQRWAEDHKAEQRPVPSFAQRRELASAKYHRRIKSAVQEIAAHVVNFTLRRRYSEVIYNDQERWLGDFPYAALEARLRTLCDEKQIAFTKVDPNEAAGEAQPTDRPL
jgi:hypothetical protein